MRFISVEKLSEIQSNATCIRNICILAHVDHGKTTLADSLVASNGIISNKLAGKLRYLDSRPDEQIRGITMKSSSITLCHIHNETDYIINLIDSPGHVDFSFEVSTAVRLSDGAFIVVDVVEGVCPQTRSALSISYVEGLKPILVLNKIDRLIIEMKLTPLDAYVRLTQVLEQVNAIMGELFASDVMEREEREETVTVNSNKVNERDLADWQSVLEEIDDSNLYFSPEQGNVLFTSAIDGWGFGIKEFAKIYSNKLGFSEKVLRKTLWGDFYINNKTKRIMKGAQEKAKKPLFVQFILDNIWVLYETIVIRKDKDKLPTMAQKLNIKLTTRDLRHTDPKAQLQAVCSQWLPLAQTCLDMVCEKVPAPCNLTDGKIERLISGNNDFSALPLETQRLKTAFLLCHPSPEVPTIVFVSKMFPVERDMLPENRPKSLTSEELAQRREIVRQKHAEQLERKTVTENHQENTHNSVVSHEDVKQKDVTEDRSDGTLVAFARVYSGTIKIGDEVFVLGPKHNPAVALEREKAGEEVDSSLVLKDLKPGKHITKVTISKLYILMGRELEAVNKVPAGNVFGIGGLEEHVLKTATLSTTVACPSFTELTSLAVPILRVAIEPKHPNDLPKLISGLKLLNQADACAIVHMQENGEIVLSTAGEVHLERCLEDLKLRYAKVDINVSDPIVPFRETIVPPPKLDMVNEAIEKKVEEGRLEIWTSNRQCCFEIDARPLPENVTKLLEKNSNLIKLLDSYYDRDIEQNGEHENFSGENQPNERFISDKKQKEAKIFKNELEAAFLKAGWEDNILDKIWSFGPRKCGPNILLNETDYKQKKYWEQQGTNIDSRAIYDSSIVNGFQLATLAGPLCEEPMMGVCFVLKKWEIFDTPQSDSGGQNQGHLGGQLMSACKEACRRIFSLRHPRLMTATYSCSVLVNSDVLAFYINRSPISTELPIVNRISRKRHFLRISLSYFRRS
ncbi:elongation factor-like GTPase 1 isoform X2 [Anoplolepis gracilipes]|uniref:elongation factor-like GTPase 1 isoform X2 n=1 Tax=Anoplolepis gracilipes TaxID=354296 RepID=UPI003BA0F850